MKNKMKRFVWIILLALALAGGVVFWIKTQREAKKPHFDTEAMERGTIVSTVNTTGIVQAVISVEIGSQVSGKIHRLYVDFNSRVRKGQVLAKIDPSLFQAQADEASANVESAKATYANFQAQYENALAKVKAAQASVKSYEAQVEISRANLASAVNKEKSAKAEVNKAVAQLENDRVEYKRSEELMSKDFISRSEMDAAETKYKVSLANLDVARATFEQASSAVKSAEMQLDAARYNLESTKVEEESQKALAKAVQAQVRQSLAQVMTASGRLKEALVNLSYTDIRSPIDGVVVVRAVDAGQTVAAAFQAPRLFLIARDLRDMEVFANVDEADIGKVKEGMQAVFTVDAFPEKRFKGSVRQVRSASTVDQGVVKYQVIISAPNPELKLKPGMTANVIITSETKDNCLKVPNGAIRFRPDSVPNFPFPERSKNGKREKKDKALKEGEEPERFNTVWVYEGENKVREKKVVLGITDGRYTEMKKGSLREGEELIIGTKSGAPKSPGAKPGGARVRLF